MRQVPERPVPNTPIVALVRLKWRGPEGVELQVLPLYTGADPVDACQQLFEMGVADVIGALTQEVTLQYAATFVPGIAGCPEVAWIAVPDNWADVVGAS